MKITLLAALLGSAALAQPAAAAPADTQGPVRSERWRHEESGISLPRSIGDMNLAREQDASGGGGHDVVLSYAGEHTPVTVYVYRSSYPNAAIWFERTRLAMNMLVGAGGEAANPRTFTLGGASAPNGLREEIALPGGRATGVAIAQAGEWLVKVRMTSDRLDRAGLAERMDRIVGAIQFARPIPAPHPLAVPSPCGGDGAAMRGRRIGNVDSRTLAAASAYGLVAFGEARGMSGLAAEPTAWCRVSGMAVPPQYGSLYRRRDGKGWVALLGDAGRAATAGPIEAAGDARAALYVSTPASTQVVAVYDGMPGMAEGIAAAIPVVLGRARGIAEIGTERSAGPAPDKD
ncbi:MAG TPA: hypothetical protein VGB79_12975 [Allosphingosinicella sp.]|jgi:hypothetical protein